MRVFTVFMTAIAITVMSFSVQAIPTDYLVLSWSEVDGLKVLSHQVVDLPESTHKNTSRPKQGNFVILSDEFSLEETYVSLKHAQFTRSEHHGHDHIDGQYIANEEQIFVLKIPQKKAVSISIHDQQNHKISITYDKNQLLKSSNVINNSISTTEGPAIDNRVNLLIMGDGYTNGEEGDFNDDADDVIAYMQTFEPYQSYASFISFDKLFTASNQSGADHPLDPCGDGTADPLAPSFVDTAFDATFCTFNIHRLLTVNSTKVFNAAAASPNWDAIVVIVNDTTYGGSGGPFSTISTNDLATDVFIHEYGHSFTGLADEYDTPFPSFPSCTDLGGGPDCEANVTDESIRNNIKWNYFIDNSTPIPTPENGSFNDVIGLFEGARYLASGMYRPKNFCNMQFLGFEFCEVCQEAYVLELYAGDYGQSGNPLSLIEPGSRVPAGLSPSGTVSIPMTFSVDTLQPTHGLGVRWLVDDVLVSDVTSTSINQSFEYTPTMVGQISIKVRIKDESNLIHSSRIDELPVFEREWLLDVTAPVDLIFEDGFE